MDAHVFWADSGANQHRTGRPGWRQLKPSLHHGNEAKSRRRRGRCRAHLLGSPAKRQDRPRKPRLARGKNQNFVTGPSIRSSTWRWTQRISSGRRSATDRIARVTSMDGANPTCGFVSGAEHAPGSLSYLSPGSGPVPEAAGVSRPDDRLRSSASQSFTLTNSGSAPSRSRCGFPGWDGRSSVPGRCRHVLGTDRGRGGELRGAGELRALHRRPEGREPQHHQQRRELAGHGGALGHRDRRPGRRDAPGNADPTAARHPAVARRRRRRRRSRPSRPRGSGRRGSRSL